MRKEFNFTLGADPEFNLVMQGRRIMAENTLHELLDGDRKFIKEDMGYRVGKVGEIGWDGASATGEIRPAPAKTADGLVNNLEEIFTAFHKKAPLFDISTLSYYGSVGGHVHFSVPVEFASIDKIRGIHKRLASFYLPIMLSENKINLQLRLKGSYGRLSDWREQDYKDEGKITGYEFRTPSAEWLTTKKIATATLAYLGTVYNEIINHPAKLKKYSDIFYKTEVQADALQKLALSDYKTLTQGIYNRIKKIVRTFEFYPTYKDEIEYILNPGKVMKDKTKVEYNIVAGWDMRRDILKKTKIKKRDLTSKKKIKTLSKNYNLDILTPLVNIIYNDDANVGLFSKALAERITIFNWKLKNRYFLFGLKKGINNFLVFDMKQNIYEGKDMIKTTGDLKETVGLMQKMISKFAYASENQIDPEREIIYGKDIASKKTPLVIGIPYDIRTDNNINPLISMVYSLETRKIKPVAALEINGLKEDTVSAKGETVEKGLLHSIMTEPAENPEDHVVYDQGSRSLQAAAQNAEEVIREERAIERSLEYENINDIIIIPEGSLVYDESRTGVVSLERARQFNWGEDYIRTHIVPPEEISHWRISENGTGTPQPENQSTENQPIVEPGESETYLDIPTQEEEEEETAPF